MEKFKFTSKEGIPKLPRETGVYAFYDKKALLYIGKASDIKERVKNHFQQPGFRDNFFVDQVSKIGYLKTDSEIEALLLEAALIKKHQPKFNVTWRDDKNYFFVSMTEEKYPQVFITHQPKKSAKLAGPFVDGKSLKETLKFLRKIFPYRSCRLLPRRSCLWYHLGRCPAPCTLNSRILDVPQIKEKLEREAQKDAHSLFAVIRGKKSQVLSGMEKEMKKFSKAGDFEKAGKIRDRIFSLKKILLNARVFEKQTIPQENGWKGTEQILRKIISSEKPLTRVEAYDISNIHGKEATGSMVAFISGQPDKSHYRKFKIKGEFSPAGNKSRNIGPNDIAMLNEILTRRFRHKEWLYPELALIDGGMGQINAALKIKEKNPWLKNIKFISLAKKNNELFVEGKKKALLLKNLPRPVSNLILYLRDEAHRFAISYHKKLREADMFGKTQHQSLRA